MTLMSLKEESKREARDEPVDDMPWDYWSRLLLTVDGWLLEKKIVSDDADSLREIVWKKEESTIHTLMSKIRSGTGSKLASAMTAAELQHLPSLTQRISIHQDMTMLLSQHHNVWTPR